MEPRRQATGPMAVLLLTASGAGQSMVQHERVELIAGVGVTGDRYTTGDGHWSAPRWPDQQLTLVEAELADELGVAPALLRRNIVTRGVQLDDLISREFQLGDALLRGVRRCDPCRYLESLTRPGLFDQLDERGGLRAEVLRSGMVAVGDSIILP